MSTEHPRSTARRIRTGRLGRLASGVAVLGSVTAIAVVGSSLPAPAGAPATDPAVRVPPAATELVCPGPVVLPERTTPGDAAFDPTPVQTRTTVRAASIPVAGGEAGALSVVTLDGAEPLLTLDREGGGALVGAASAVDGPTLLRAEPMGGEAPLAGGASASITTEGDLRGLAAATCAEPSASAWLVGGSTEIGSSATLVVTNPGRTPAEVSLEVWGPNGRVEDLGGSTFLVAPGTERALLLEGIAAEQRRLTVHVTAAGGQVAAYLQDSRLIGFTPAGTDLVTAGAPPATRQVVGGLLVAASQTGDEDAALVRMLAPGDDDARARLTLLGLDGPVTLPGAEEVALVAGQVTDVSLAGLPEGAYTAVVDADVPVVAGAMLARPGPPIELDDVPTLERAWVATQEGAAAGLVAVPGDLAATLVIGSPGTGRVDDAGDAGDDADDAGGSDDAGGADDADGSDDSAAEPTDAADAAGPPVGGVLRVLGEDGRLLSEERVSVPVGTTLRIDEQRLGGGAVVAVLELVPDVVGGGPEGGSPQAPTARDLADSPAPPALVWGVVTTVGPADQQLLSVLSPVPRPDPSPSVQVSQGARLGLP